MAEFYSHSVCSSKPGKTTKDVQLQCMSQPLGNEVERQGKQVNYTPGQLLLFKEKKKSLTDEAQDRGGVSGIIIL